MDGMVGIMEVSQTVNGKQHKGHAFWSDRTIPGKWVYPDWYQENSLDSIEINRLNDGPRTQ